MPRLDHGVHDGHPELARRPDPVLAEGHDPDGHRVLGQVRVRPFVDVVGQPVAPVLQELGRGPRVVDLVEVHLVRLVEPPHADGEEADREDGQHPYVEAVQPAASLVFESPTPVAAQRRVGQARLEPRPWPDADGVVRVVPDRGHRTCLPDLRRARAGEPVGRRSAREGRCPAREQAAGRLLERFVDGAARIRSFRHATNLVVQIRLERPSTEPSVEARGFALPAGSRRVLRQPLDRLLAQLEERPAEHRGLGQGGDRDAPERCQRRPDAEPVVDVRVFPVPRRQDDVHVREHRRAGEEIGDPPAQRDRGEDRADGDQWVQVALVDARRQHEERERQHGDPNQDGQAIGTAGNEPQRERGREKEQCRSDQPRRERADEQPIRARVLRCRGRGPLGDDERADPELLGTRRQNRRIAHPRPVDREAVPAAVGGLLDHERPRVERIHGQVRVARGGLHDLRGEARQAQAERP